MTLKAQVIQKNNRALKRLQWATMGRDQADEIIRDINSLVGKLYQLLDSLDREKRARVDEILLRDILSRSATASDVDEIEQLLSSSPSPSNGTLQAAARLKKIRLIIGADRREDEVRTEITKQTKNQMPTITKFKFKKIGPYTSDRPLTYQGMETARYDQKPVLVEWKFVERPLWKEMQEQVKCLAVMLASPACKDSQSLRCMGYLPWEDRELYALVYEIPGDSALADCSVKTLFDLIAEQRHLSLACRFDIAKKMARAVLQLHTVGWLHKSLRTSHIVYLAPTGSSASEFLRGAPYLIGYEYARPDTANAAAFTQLPDTELRNDLYRHPQARGIRRERYRKQFDMYALGCIFLEVGMWRKLSEIAVMFLDANLEDNIRAANDNTISWLPYATRVAMHT
ncbi:hypothetical protein SVAN01_02519 [Stagonosporopsis vannaccii]|nr:hypothetical protein SVAN01_02519 [Stagonosporopsis vannaccii]